MQRAILLLPRRYLDRHNGTPSYACQGLHWHHGNILNNTLNAHHGTPDDAANLVLGNRIISIDKSTGYPERSKFRYAPRWHVSVQSAARRNECLTVHVYHDGAWQWMHKDVCTFSSTLEFYSDPGHGWLKVRRIAAQAIMRDDFALLTPYSYQRGEWIYLEEDCDAAMFMRTAQARGLSIKVKVRDQANVSSPIRRYDSLSTAG